MDNVPGVMLLTLRFRVPWCRSLKDRRSEIKRILGRMRARFNVSSVESGPQDVHTLFQISLCALCFSNAQADSIKQELLSFLEGISEAELYDISDERL